MKKTTLAMSALALSLGLGTDARKSDAIGGEY